MRRYIVITFLSPHLISLALLTSIIGCSPARKITHALDDLYSNEKLFNDHYSGFVLYDLESGETLFSQNGDRLFTPASNTKILTLLTALTILPDSLPSFYYATQALLSMHLVKENFDDRPCNFLNCYCGAHWPE